MVLSELVLHLDINRIWIFHKLAHWWFVPSLEEHLLIIIVPLKIVFKCSLCHLLLFLLLPADVGTPKRKSVRNENVEQQNVNYEPVVEQG